MGDRTRNLPLGYAGLEGAAWRSGDVANRALPAHPARTPMNTPTFFPALMAALQFREPRPEGLRQLSDSDWHELLAFSDRAHLTLPLILRSKQSVPAWVCQRAGHNLADNRKR